MQHRCIKIFFLLIGAMNIFLSAQPSAKNNREGMVLISGGIYTPLYGSNKENLEITVKPFYLDTHPVTNAQYLQFIKSNPKWQRSKVKKLFADENYLRSWKSDFDFGDRVLSDAPVTNISWFAAKAYCEYYGKRLPSTSEWELTAKANRKMPDGSKDQRHIKQILEWYSKPMPEIIPVVGSTEKNYWGISDMHGLVWEWTSDFFTSLVTGESRGDSGLERNLFCGSGSVNASDFKNYPAFMRFAFRSSLKANYTTNNLGFRCAMDYK